jgi:hypothetical protein
MFGKYQGEEKRMNTQPSVWQNTVFWSQVCLIAVMPLALFLIVQ